MRRRSILSCYILKFGKSRCFVADFIMSAKSGDRAVASRATTEFTNHSHIASCVIYLYFPRLGLTIKSATLGRSLTTLLRSGRRPRSSPMPLEYCSSRDSRDSAPLHVIGSVGRFANDFYLRSAEEPRERRVKTSKENVEIIKCQPLDLPHHSIFPPGILQRDPPSFPPNAIRGLRT